jgi:hypothetical protein
MQVGREAAASTASPVAIRSAEAEPAVRASAVSACGVGDQ